ncbi:MAG: potassium channel family protein [Thermoleophilia bacterium]
MVDAIAVRLRVFFLLLVIVVVVGTVGFTLIEHLALVDSFYLTIVTVATVGYGDLAPATLAGKILAIILIFGGAGSFLGVFTGVSEATFSRREKRVRLQNLHLVMGVFFSELGNTLLRRFATADPQVTELAARLSDIGRWKQTEFSKGAAGLRGRHYRLAAENLDFATVYESLLEKRPVLVRILENPTLQEHESFTDLLRATFHLTEELALRADLAALSEKDGAHLAGDATRVYGLLVPIWLAYMSHLSDQYPYLFSLSVRMNPFDPEASPVVRDQV